MIALEVLERKFLRKSFIYPSDFEGFKVETEKDLDLYFGYYCERLTPDELKETISMANQILNNHLEFIINRRKKQLSDKKYQLRINRHEFDNYCTYFQKVIDDSVIKATDYDREDLEITLGIGSDYDVRHLNDILDLANTVRKSYLMFHTKKEL